MRVAVSFESGGDPAACAATLEALRRAEIHATIFLDGRWADRHRALLGAMAEDHEFGNHAYSHSDLTTLSDEEIEAELERTEALAVSATGCSTRPWLRPPFQRMDARVQQVAGRHGYHCLARDALDGAHYLGLSTTEAIVDRSVARAADTMVLTYHLHNRQTAAALPQIAAQLRRRGAHIGPLSSLPSPPPPRAPLHQDFRGIQVEPGYVRLHHPVPPPQMVNLLGLGAEPEAPVDLLSPVGPGTSLLVFNGRQPVTLPARMYDHQVTCLEGDVMIDVRDREGRVVYSALSCRGDSLEIRAGCAVALSPGSLHRRAILLTVGCGD